MARKFDIAITKGYDWSIIERKYAGRIGKLPKKHLPGDYPFGVTAVDKAGRIVHIFDPFIDGEMFEYAEKHKEFKEVVDFDVYIQDGVIETSFTGDFIDALEYLETII